jgi:predicted nucleotide-binding protein
LFLQGAFVSRIYRKALDLLDKNIAEYDRLIQSVSHDSIWDPDFERVTEETRKLLDYLGFSGEAKYFPASDENEMQVTALMIPGSPDELDEYRDYLKTCRAKVQAYRNHVASTWEDGPEEFAASQQTQNVAKDDPRRVFVVYGRNLRAKDALFKFLKAVRLEPRDFPKAAVENGSGGAPFIGLVLDKEFRTRPAFLVLLTPDDEVSLRRRLCRDEDDPEGQIAYQARPNVFFEAGMALAISPERTVFASLGDPKGFSDLQGRHLIRLSDSAIDRHALLDRLRAVGCKPQITRTRWRTIGDFSSAICLKTLVFRAGKSPVSCGWKYWQSPGEASAPTFASAASSPSGHGLQIMSSVNHHFDYDLRQKADDIRKVEFVTKPSSRPAQVYVGFSAYTNTGVSKQVWLMHNFADTEVKVVSDTEHSVEWIFPYDERELGNDWCCASLGLSKAREQVLEPKGLRLRQLNKLRLRGTLSIDRVDVQ